MVVNWKNHIFDQKWTLGVERRFWPKNRKFDISTKIGPKMVPRGLKSIFGWKMEKLIFRPKMDPGGQKSTFGQKSSFHPQGPLFVENMIFSIYDQKLIWNLPGTFLGLFWSKNWTFDFLTKNWFWPRGSIFCQKIEFWNFRPKIDLRPLNNIFGPILVEKLNFRFLIKNRVLTPRVHFWSKIRIFRFSIKNRFETSREHF